MSAIYDNWERLVRATIRREELRLIALRTPSDLSLASSSPSLSASSSFNFIPPSNQVSSFNFSSVGYSFTYAQVLQATDNLSNSNLILIGRSGYLFYGVLEDGTKVVFKMIDSSSVEKVSFLMSELEFFARVSHPNFVPLLGHCFEDWNHKFLVYKYMPNKDLSTFFYMKTDSDNGPSTLLDWKMRLKVAIGVAQALCHLHHHCVPPLVHGNVEASSILIDENYDAHLGRLIQVCPEKKDSSQSRISKLLRLPKGFLQYTAGASDGTRAAYDVYSFGKVLLELVTGYPVSSILSNSEMTDWMENVLPYITTYDKELFANVMDPSLTKDEGVLDEVWTVAVVAKACLSPKPSKRPLMANVIKGLEDLDVVAQAPAKLRIPEGSEVGTSTASTNGTSSDIWTTTWNSQFSPASGIEEAYRNREMWDFPNLIVFSFEQLRTATRKFSSDGLLGEGGFGRVYKGCLPQKSTSKSGKESLIAVKRWSPDGLQGFKEWRTEIDMLGRLSHPNLIKLLGYCSEDKELLLVYEYMPRGSLNNHLYGRGSAVRPLSWSTRLKILIGAARGLAYLHALKREVIFRDFKTSSVLLDTSYNAKLSDFGLAKMGPSENETHVSTRVVGTHGYAAPEYVATGRLYVKSDVFGFGVVMAEVLTGLRAFDPKRPSEQKILTDWIKPHLSNNRKMWFRLDSRLQGRYPGQAAVEMAQLAVTCLSRHPEDRPSMKQVVEKLEHIQIIGEKHSAIPTPA